MKNFKHILSTMVLASMSVFAFAQCAGGETEITIDMTDSFGDGWNGNTYSIATNPGGSVVATGDLDGAQTGDGDSFGQDVLCLTDGTYDITVGGGSFTGEVGWSISTAGGGVIASGGAPTTVTFMEYKWVKRVSNC